MSSSPHCKRQCIDRSNPIEPEHSKELDADAASEESVESAQSAQSAQSTKSAKSGLCSSVYIYALDESGSMGSKRGAMWKTVKDEIEAIDDEERRFAVLTFSNVVRAHRASRDLFNLDDDMKDDTPDSEKYLMTKEETLRCVARLERQPNAGRTALYDAIVTGVAIGTRLIEECALEAQRVVLRVLTDGQNTVRGSFRLELEEPTKRTDACIVETARNSVSSCLARRMGFVLLQAGHDQTAIRDLALPSEVVLHWDDDADHLAVALQSAQEATETFMSSTSSTATICFTPLHRTQSSYQGTILRSERVVLPSPRTLDPPVISRGSPIA